MKHLGETIDIHAGGQDLQFPHHENEIAQSELATGKPFARYWLHVAFLRVNGQRMGKSKRNFIFVRDALKDYSAEAIRHFLISAHYRHPLDYSSSSLKESSSAIRRLNNCLDALKPYQSMTDTSLLDSDTFSEVDTSILEAIQSMRDGFEEAMDADFNTARAIGEIFKFVGEVNQTLAETGENLADTTKAALGRGYGSLKEMCEVLGIYSELTESGDGNMELLNQLMNLIIEIRQTARLHKDWETADKIRDRLKQLSIELQDTRHDVTWKITD